MEAEHFSGLLTIQIVASCLDCDRNRAVDWLAENGNPLFSFAAAAAFADHFHIGHNGGQAAWASGAGRDMTQIAAARDVVKRVIGNLALAEPERRLSRRGFSTHALMWNDDGKWMPAVVSTH